MHDYLTSQIAAARRADLHAEAANRRLVREARAARRSRQATESPARPARSLRLPLWRRPRLAS